VTHSGRKMVKKVQITFTNEQWEIIKELRGKFGNTNAEIVRNIVIAFLSEKTYMKGKKE
jgi:predicted DNA-binding protein